MRKAKSPEIAVYDDPREALERILELCNQSTQYTRRTSHIHEVAMQALGMTQNQRVVRHTRCEDRAERLKELLIHFKRGEAHKILEKEFHEKSQSIQLKT